jgi:hypothetical protein
VSQPGRPGPPGRTPAPLRVSSERLTEDEAREAAAAAQAAPRPAPAPPTPAASAAPTAPLSVPPAAPGGTAAPVLARPSLPVVAAPPRRRLGDLWRLVFARRRAGRHRPETTPPHSWSMFAPQRRRRRRWGRR